MSYSKDTRNIPDKIRIDTQTTDKNEDKGEIISCNAIGCTYAVTVSKKQSPSNEEARLCCGQKSFISIHSTDQLCQVADMENASILDECNVEVISLNEVFPSTSEESLSNEEESIVQKKQKHRNKASSRKSQENVAKTAYVPSNSKSSTVSGRQLELLEGPATVYSDFDIPKSTMYVVGSNPGEPKISYPDSPKKFSKAMKKTLRTIDKHKNEQNSKINEKAIRKLQMRGILKDGGWRKDGGPECTGDTSVEGAEMYTPSEDLMLPFSLDYGPQAKQSPDKNVKFNKQVVIIHFKGDHFVGHSVEKLSKERDQQARNSELRKTFLTKYNEFWPTAGGKSNYKLN